MQWFIVLSTAVVLLFGTMPTSQAISEKIIVSSSENMQVIEEDFLKLKVYTIENESLKFLQEQHQFKIKIEQLDVYNTIVIDPLHSVELRNELFVILSPLFKNMFYIESLSDARKIISQPKQTTKTSSKKTATTSLKSESELFSHNEVGLQWIAIWILSALGLFLSIASRKKLIAFDKLQIKLKKRQTKMETEINQLGARDE